MPLAPNDFKRIALSFPEAHEKLSYGAPAVFIAKRFFTRLRAEDDGIVLLLDSIDEREMLLEAAPDLYFMTDHFRNYPYVLARLGHIDEPTLRARLDRIWRKIAPKKLVKQHDAQGARASGAKAAAAPKVLRAGSPRAQQGESG